MQSYQFQIEGEHIHNIYQGIKKEFGHGSEYVSPTGTCYFFNYERFSFWQNSDMSCTILVDIWTPQSCFVKIVVAGGKAGLFRLDIFGRERSNLRKLQTGIERICQFYQWQLFTARPIPQPFNQAPPAQGQATSQPPTQPPPTGNANTPPLP